MYMNWDNLGDFAFVNTDTLKGEPKGIVLNLHGYTDGTMFDKSNAFAAKMGENGIVYVFPYHSVWAWMSKSSMAYIEEVLDTVYKHYGFDEKTPFVISGGSMGGMTAIMYGIFGKKKPIACTANCPVTDLEKMLSHDMTRAIYSAFILEDKPFSECVKEHSPILNISKLPKIPYRIMLGEKDTAITASALKFTEKMKQNGFDINTSVVAGMGHCNLADFAPEFNTYLQFIINAV